MIIILILILVIYPMILITIDGYRIDRLYVYGSSSLSLCSTLLLFSSLLFSSLLFTKQIVIYSIHSHQCNNNKLLNKQANKQLIEYFFLSLYLTFITEGWMKDPVTKYFYSYILIIYVLSFFSFFFYSKSFSFNFGRIFIDCN